MLPLGACMKGVLAIRRKEKLKRGANAEVTLMLGDFGDLEAEARQSSMRIRQHHLAG